MNYIYPEGKQPNQLFIQNRNGEFSQIGKHNGKEAIIRGFNTGQAKVHGTNKEQPALWINFQNKRENPSYALGYFRRPLFIAHPNVRPSRDLAINHLLSGSPVVKLTNEGIFNHKFDNTLIKKALHQSTNPLHIYKIFANQKGNPVQFLNECKGTQKLPHAEATHTHLMNADWMPSSHTELSNLIANFAFKYGVPKTRNLKEIMSPLHYWEFVLTGLLNPSFNQ